MRLAITADVHLRTYKETPERYHALADILKKISAIQIDKLVVCGDLFDKDCSNYSDFEKLASTFKNISFLILPGNHDPNISSKYIVGDNIKIFEQPEIIEGTYNLLFVPYSPGKTMGLAIAPHVKNLGRKNWILFGHGDWSDGLKVINPTEPGIYMPLTRVDIDQYLPARVILGHIHVPRDGTVIYPGSPCGIDITETGKRRFIVYDNSANTIEYYEVDTDFIFQECNFVILPVENEEAYIKEKITKIKQGWKIQDSDLKKIILRVIVRGYSRDKNLLDKIVKREFIDYSFYKGIPPDISEVNVTVDNNLIKIAETVKAKIDSLELISSPDEPDRDEIIMHSLKLIFEV
jgi:DNA repair exonuclease SbcCD nuclease subunit